MYIENRIEKNKSRRQKRTNQSIKRRLVFLKVEKGKLQRSETENNKNKPICETHVIKKRTDIKESSSEKERKENALALGAEEGRDKLRKATGSCK